MSDNGELTHRRAASLDILKGSIAGVGFKKAVRIPFPYLGNDFSVRHALGRRRTIEAEISRTMDRTQIAIVDDPAGKPLAFLQATAYRLNGAHADDFVDTCDAESQAAYNVAEVLRANWDLGELLRQDDILVVDRIAVHPDVARIGLMTTLLDWALPQLAPKPVITILKAFPLQFEGTGKPHDAEFRALQSGLVDYYRRKMGLVLLPGDAGKEGWLYRSSLPLDPV